MDDSILNAGEALRTTAERATAAVEAQADRAISQGKVAFDQIASKSREAMEQNLKTVDRITSMVRGNVDVLLASSHVASGGIEVIAREVADYTRKSLERTAAAARALTTAKTSTELMQLQSDFAKTQFDAAITEMTTLSEAMFKLMGDVFEPLQKRAVTASQISELMGDS